MYIIYTTTPTHDEAVKLANIAIEEKIAACANIIKGMTSIYQWEGKLQQSEENIVIFKTTEPLVSKLSARIKELHSYDCPSIFAIKTDNCDKDFLKWVENSVKLSY